MAIRIGSNIASLQAQRRLGDSTSTLSKVYERLSSGQRINRAADDAAGLSISQALNSDARVFQQGVRNINDGISVINIAAGALQQLSSITIRLKELAEQSANGNYGDKQRDALDTESNSLVLEYNRIIASTKFNGRNLLDVSQNNGDLSLQAGYGSTGTISTALASALARTDGGSGVFSAATVFSFEMSQSNLNRAVESLDINGDGFKDLVGIGNEEVSIALGDGAGGFTPGWRDYIFTTYFETFDVADVNSDGKDDILTSNGLILGSASNPTYVAFGETMYSLAAADFNNDGKIDFVGEPQIGGGLKLYLGNGNGTFSSSVITTQGMFKAHLDAGDINNDGLMDFVTAFDTGEIYTAIGKNTGGFTFTATGVFDMGVEGFNISLADMNSDNKLDIVYSSGETIKIASNLGSGTYSSSAVKTAAEVEGPFKIADLNGDGLNDIIANTVGPRVFLANGDGNYAQSSNASSATDTAHAMAVADFNRDGLLDIAVGRQDLNAEVYFQTKGSNSKGIFLTLNTQSGSRAAISVLDAQLTRITSELGKMGAFQSRLSFAAADLQSRADTFKQAESRIKDSDIAQDAAALVREQVKQQAATSILAQANLDPRLALRLLQP